MEQWHRIMRKVLDSGESRADRTGVGTLALFGEQLVFDCRGSFPAVTTKRLAFGQVAAELACFLRGYGSLEQFHSMGCTIWDGNGGSDYWKSFARSEGDLGRIYGVQWRGWQSVLPGGAVRRTDQLADLVEGLRRDPHSRRHLVVAYNPGELDQVCLPACHVLFQCFAAGSRLDLRVDMRSVDLFLGLPFDVASYALLLGLLAAEVGLDSGFLVFQLGDAHVYLNHLDQVREAISREPLPPPRLALSPDASVFDFHPKMAKLIGYEHHPALAAPLNV